MRHATSRLNEQLMNVCTSATSHANTFKKMSSVNFKPKKLIVLLLQKFSFLAFFSGCRGCFIRTSHGDVGGCLYSTQYVNDFENVGACFIEGTVVVRMKRFTPVVGASIVGRLLGPCIRLECCCGLNVVVDHVVSKSLTTIVLGSNRHDIFSDSGDR